MKIPVLPIRTRILLVVLAVSVIPLAVLGLWLTGATARSGEALLRERLAITLDETAAAISQSWTGYRSALLNLADVAGREALAPSRRPDPDVSSSPGTGGMSAATPDILETRFRARVDSLDDAVLGVSILDSNGSAVLTLDRGAPGVSRTSVLGTPFHAVIPVRDPATREVIGGVRARIEIAALRGVAPSVSTPGAVVAAFDRSTGASLLPLPFDPSLLETASFEWTDERWLVNRRLMSDPGIELRAAAPLAPFTEPFRQAAARGTWALFFVATLGLGLTAVLTGRVTGALEHLASAAEAVSGGDLQRRLPEGRPDEVGRVAQAFNAMTDSLAQTLSALADREALAALGEFATSIAHEIRTPLTAIQLDLQEVEERLPADSALRTLQSQAVEDLRRLDRTVSGVLQLARSGRIEARKMDLGESTEAALRVARPIFEAADVGFELVAETGPEPVMIAGDPEALERAILNLLHNAAQATKPGGSVRVTISRTTAGATVSVADAGPGMTAELKDRVFEPLFSTKEDGTGVGLPIVERIVDAHGGRIDIDSAPGRGTTVHLHLPNKSTGPL